MTRINNDQLKYQLRQIMEEYIQEAPVDPELPEFQDFVGWLLQETDRE